MSDQTENAPTPDTKVSIKPEPKTEEEDANAPITVKVVSSMGDEVLYKIKRNTKLSKLQLAYAQKFGMDVNTFRFLYDGDRIQEDETPESLDMEENDAIDVMVEQVGGILHCI